MASAVELQTNEEQQPWVESGLRGADFCFAGCDGTGLTEGAEVAALSAAFQSGDARSLQTFLDQYPTTASRGLVEARIEELGGIPAEPAIQGSDRAQEVASKQLAAFKAFVETAETELGGSATIWATKADELEFEEILSILGQKRTSEKFKKFENLLDLVEIGQSELGMGLASSKYNVTVTLNSIEPSVSDPSEFYVANITFFNPAVVANAKTLPARILPEEFDFSMTREAIELDLEAPTSTLEIKEHNAEFVVYDELLGITYVNNTQPMSISVGYFGQVE